MKVKVLCRNPDDYIRETKLDIHKGTRILSKLNTCYFGVKRIYLSSKSIVQRNYDPALHPFQQCREYVRALNATKLERVFAKPFLGCLDGHSDGVHCFANHPKQLSTLLSGAYDGEIRVWDISSMHCLNNFQAHSGYVRGICVEPGGDFMFSVGDDKTIKQWNFQSKDEPQMSILTKRVLLDISHHWKQNLYATCGEGVHIWDHNRASAVREFNWSVESVYKIRFNPVEVNLLGATASDRSVILYDCRGQAPLRKVIMKLRSNAIAWNPMEAFSFTIANEDYNLYTFDMRNLSMPVNIHMDHVGAVMDVCYSPTGREFVSGSYDKTVRIFCCSKGRSREVYHTKRMQRVMAVQWSLDSKYVLSGSDEMNIRLWKANAAEKLGPTRSRESKALQYADRLKERFAAHPEIRRIARHRQVPKTVFHAQKELRTIHQSQSRKEANRRAHSKPGAVPFVPERKKHTVTEEV